MKPALFDFNGAALRVIREGSGVWFVASDVCRVLEIQNVTQAVERLDEDERSMFNIGRQGSASIINESGLYSLVLSSRKPQAKAFKKWVTSEVLPSIRATGFYSKSSGSDHATWLIRQMLKLMPADKLLALVLPLHTYGSLAPNGKQRHGFRRPAFITQKHRRKEAREIHERGIVLKYLAQNLQLGEGES